MSLPYYLDENNNKVFYNPNSNKITVHTAYYNSLDEGVKELSILTGEDGDAVATKSINTDITPPAPASADLSLKKLIGLTDSEIERFKDKLINQSLQNIDYDLTQPTTTINSPILNHLASANNMRAGREQREILMSKAKAEYMKTDIQIRLKELELKKSELSIKEASLSLQAEQLVFSQRLLNSTERLNLNLGELRGSLASLKNSSKDIATAAEQLAEGVESQKAVNEKLLQKLNQETAKDISYNGQTYTKTEIEKLGAVENLKGAKDENEFNLNEALELVEDFFTDGFDLETNPIEILINSLKDSLKTEFNDINIKYNLGLGDLK